MMAAMLSTCFSCSKKLAFLFVRIERSPCTLVRLTTKPHNYWIRKTRRANGRVFDQITLVRCKQSQSKVGHNQGSNVFTNSRGLKS
ncbi:hypothetical protein ANCCAN_20708 [Ancylostoma caninum]|uniref:Uncharacterized protein n=1 Tax=Ancylostoma caninum TaxID=29170 RepID=A0A368FPJ8_ANCCA|nr:hypothetical protein ANCCAN_20708 [Ancylostoma caninum]